MTKEKIIEARLRGMELVLRHVLPALHAAGVVDLARVSAEIEEADLRVAEMLPTPPGEIEMRSESLAAAKQILSASLRAAAYIRPTKRRDHPER